MPADAGRAHGIYIADETIGAKKCRRRFRCTASPYGDYDGRGQDARRGEDGTQAHVADDIYFGFIALHRAMQCHGAAMMAMSSTPRAGGGSLFRRPRPYHIALVGRSFG